MGPGLRPDMSWLAIGRACFAKNAQGGVVTDLANGTAFREGDAASFFGTAGNLEYLPHLLDYSP